MSVDGLYMLRLDEPRAQLEIYLYDGENLQGMIAGEVAGDIYAHFRTLADHGQRDAFVYGVLMGTLTGQAGSFVMLAEGVTEGGR